MLTKPAELRRAQCFSTAVRDVVICVDLMYTNLCWPMGHTTSPLPRVPCSVYLQVHMLVSLRDVMRVQQINARLIIDV